tara:strand:+ start:3873 stop:4031 length:159 start_codon:yes stop_codon:yes gene_type:complete
MAFAIEIDFIKAINVKVMAKGKTFEISERAISGSLKEGRPSGTNPTIETPDC